jgi:hypothetical protein
LACGDGNNAWQAGHERNDLVLGHATPWHGFHIFKRLIEVTTTTRAGFSSSPGITVTGFGDATRQAVVDHAYLTPRDPAKPAR